MRRPSLTPSLACYAPDASGLYTLSLHDALPIYQSFTNRKPDVLARTREDWERAKRNIATLRANGVTLALGSDSADDPSRTLDRKSTRLNSSHRCISYAVFCLKKKKKITAHDYTK